MHEHLVVFDAQCPWCYRAVRHILDLDAQQRFVFAPLDGQTAQDVLTGPQARLKLANSIVLVENYQSTKRLFWSRSTALLRVYWLYGNGWRLRGSLCFFPQWVGDLYMVG